RSAWWWAVVLPAVAVALVLFQFNPSQHGFYPRCWLYVATRIHCPGFGSLRALHQLAHGHLLTALHCNALLVLSLPFFAVFAARWTRCWVAGLPLPRISLSPAWVTVIAVLMAVFTVLRNLPCEPFTWLAPIG